MSTQIETTDLEKEVERLKKVNRTLRARIQRMQKRHGNLIEEIEELDKEERLPTKHLYHAEGYEPGCKKCGATKEAITEFDLPHGSLLMCNRCDNRVFIKSK